MRLTRKKKFSLQMTRVLREIGAVLLSVDSDDDDDDDVRQS